MKKHFADLEERAESTRLDAEEAARQLEEDRAACNHQWDNPNGIFSPERRKGYTIPADPPGTMGVDWRPAIHVPAETIQKWTRTCKICGLVEETTETEEEVVHHPRW